MFLTTLKRDTGATSTEELWALMEPGSRRNPPSSQLSRLMNKKLLLFLVLEPALTLIRPHSFT